MKRTVSVAVLFLLACVLVRAQAPVQLDSSMTPPRPLNHPHADLPPIAAAAHVDGTVIVQTTVGVDGNVTSTQVLSGPPMLQQAALDAVHRYTFTPAMLHGHPVAVKMDIKIDFYLNRQHHAVKGWGKFQQALTKCQQQTKKPGRPSDQVEACGQATQLADTLPDDAPTFDRITAYVQYATALIRDSKADDAVIVGNKAISMAKQPETLLPFCAAAYEVTGEASAVIGNLPAADQYLTQAESCQSRELQLSTTPPLKQHDSQVMKGMLQFHAKVLAAMGNQKEADSKLRQAAKL